MRKTIFLLAFIATSFLAFSQENFSPNIAIKWGPLGLIAGSLNIQGEYNFGKSSLTAKIGIPVNASYNTKFSGNDASFNLKATSFLAGYRTYLSKKHMKGIYFEPFFEYLHHTAEGTGNTTLDGEPVVMNFTNDYNGAGIGIQLGAQFIVAKRLVIDLFLIGPEINSSTNNFKAIEVSSTLPWTSIQENQAEQDIKDFVNKFPFIRNHTNIMVDQENKTVTADFKGILPGFRTGISLGVAF